MRAEQRQSRFHHVEALLLDGSTVTEACHTAGMSRAWFYRIRRHRALYAAAGFAERRLHSQPVIDAEIQRVWTEEAGQRSSIRAILEHGRKYRRDERGALQRRETMSFAIAAHTARRRLKRLGGRWCRHRRCWWAQTDTALDRLQRSPVGPVESLSLPLLSATALEEKLSAWHRRELDRRLAEWLQTTSPAAQRVFHWKVLRAAVGIARDGSHSRLARFHRDGRDFRPGGGAFSCEWALPGKAVMRLALREAPRPYRAPVAPGPDYWEFEVFDGDAPVPSAFARVAQQLIDQRDPALASAIDGARSVTRAKAQSLVAAPAALGWAVNQLEARHERVAGERLSQTLERWWRTKPTLRANCPDLSGETQGC